MDKKSLLFLIKPKGKVKVRNDAGWGAEFDKQIPYGGGEDPL